MLFLGDSHLNMFDLSSLSLLRTDVLLGGVLLVLFLMALVSYFLLV